MQRKKGYLIGIKGVGMTALAVYLKEKGDEVSGSDVLEEFPTDAILKKYKIFLKKGFSPQNINQRYDYVVVTGAHGGMTNIEAVKAKGLGLPTFMQGEFLGKIMKGEEGISVAGCHGKTTTSALIASLLTHAGFDPSFVIGTPQINDLGAAGHYGRGKYFVVEADEYMTCPLTCPKPRFLWQSPKILVITNIEYDHPDTFANIEEVKKAFLAFTQRLPDDGVLVACIDNGNIAKILAKVDRKIITYGFSSQADFRIASFSFGEGISFMKVSYQKVILGEYMLKLSGRHNLLNATGAAIVANLVGIDWEKLKEYLKLFRGTKRRFEKIGEYHGVLVYDDYAHHPSEIAATLSAFRDWFPQRRLIVIFQPHTFSRTKALFSDFAKAFSQADMVVITDIFASAREVFDPTISAQMLVIEANKYKKNAYYQPSQEETLSFLRENISQNDLIVTMGAGDIYKWHQGIIKLLNSK